MSKQISRWVSTSVAPFQNFQKVTQDFLEYVGMKTDMKKFKGLLEQFVPLVQKYTTLIGIEVEVENIKKDVPLPSYWICDIDNSLRNGGREFKLLPMPAADALMALCVLWRAMVKLTATHAPKFSWRTSIHIHVNLQDMEEEEAKNILLLSIVFEKFLFTLVGDNREQSVFCVPIKETTLDEAISGYFNNETPYKIFCSHWPKYTSVNFFRGTSLGTVEFRHLGGTLDLERVMLWITTLVKMIDFARSVSPQSLRETVANLSSHKEYYHLMGLIFGKDLMKLLPKEGLSELFSESVAYAKRLLGPTQKNMILPSSAFVKCITNKGAN